MSVDFFKISEELTPSFQGRNIFSWNAATARSFFLNRAESMDDTISLEALFKELESEEWCSAVRPCVGCKGCNKLYGNLLTRIREDLSTFARITCMYRRRCVSAIASRIREQKTKQGFTSYGQDDKDCEARMPDDKDCEARMPDDKDCEARMPDDKNCEARMPDDKNCEARMPDKKSREEVRLMTFKRPFDDLDVATPDREQAKASRTLAAVTSF